MQFGHVVDSCRMGSKDSQLQVDENGLRPLQKAFQARANHQVGSKNKAVVAGAQQVELEAVTILEGRCVEGSKVT